MWAFSHSYLCKGQFLRFLSAVPPTYCLIWQPSYVYWSNMILQTEICGRRLERSQHGCSHFPDGSLWWTHQEWFKSNKVTQCSGLFCSWLVTVVFGWSQTTWGSWWSRLVKDEWNESTSIVPQPQIMIDSLSIIRAGLVHQLKHHFICARNAPKIWVLVVFPVVWIKALISNMTYSETTEVRLSQTRYICLRRWMFV